MEFIKEEIEDMSDPEPYGIKHEDTEEQIGWCPFLILHYDYFRSCEMISSICMIIDTEMHQKKKSQHHPYSWHFRFGKVPRKQILLNYKVALEIIFIPPFD